MCVIVSWSWITGGRSRKVNPARSPPIRKWWRPILANPLLNVVDLNVFHGEAQALWDISFQIQAGEVFAIIGSNGAGKSTILKTLAGLLRPSAGRVEFLGSRIDGRSAARIVDLGLALVPEGRGLFSGLTVAENLELGAFTKRARPLMKQTMEEMAATFQIIRIRSDQLAGKMSGGEQQMLAIAKALMSKPRLLMLDEPSLGLAPLVVKTVFEIIATLKQQGVTILLVEQNIHQALRIADHACVIKTGRITLVGTGKELLSDPEIHKAYMGSLR
ncbi:MAG: ABC transporter ATP-binding protein [Desulfobacterales bacterium]|nr:MAG: ABC transporter ATP-binding protein [Desulfobacterales bacterium]